MRTCANFVTEFINLTYFSIWQYNCDFYSSCCLRCQTVDHKFLNFSAKLRAFLFINPRIVINDTPFFVSVCSIPMNAVRLERWVVMKAPTGQRFCVVRVQRPGFPKNANRWD